jgi:tetratricopeptide (TPR) repeat protein
VSRSVLVEHYLKLPQPQLGDDPDLLEAALEDGMEQFRQAVKAKYSEGTLQRLLVAPDECARRASALALGLVGTMSSNPRLATSLHDHDRLVRKFATDSLWKIWLRGSSTVASQRLHEALANSPNDPLKGIAAIDELLRHFPDFAEAYNQRAILHYSRGAFPLSILDCEAALRLNPFHFGAASGLGQCYMKLNKPRAALRAFKQSLDINPDLTTLRDTIARLEKALDETNRDAE